MRLHVPDPLSDRLVYPLFAFRYPSGKAQQGLFREHLPPNFFEEVAYVEAENAEAIMLANNFHRLDDTARAYISLHADTAERLGIPIFVFALADYADRLTFDPRVYVFRHSLYRQTKTPRDIMTPSLVEDLGREGITERAKGEIPVVSFCGRAGFKTLRSRARYVLSVVWYSVLGILTPSRRAYLPGVYWRRRAMRACVRSAQVATSFIIRKAFSAHPASIELDPATARREFIENIRESDFVLCPKGDGNYSNRFQEALSLGRFPLYIETESVLPLEGVISYDEVIVRVPMGEVNQAPDRAREWFERIPDAEYAKRQREARELFSSYLRPDAFYRYVFTKALPAGELEALNP